MNNLKSKYNNLIAISESSDTFPVKYNGHNFTCILLIRDFGCVLLISTFGNNPKTISVNIPKDFSAPVRLDNKEYLILAEALGFTGQSGNRFIPSNFFKEFDKHINPNLNRPASSKEIVRSVGRATTIAEEDKIYFCGWRRNGDKGSVQPKNYEKTKIAFGKDIADRLKKANISSRWTHIEGEENLALINDYLDMID